MSNSPKRRPQLTLNDACFMVLKQVLEKVAVIVLAKNMRIEVRAGQMMGGKKEGDAPHSKRSAALDS